MNNTFEVQINMPVRDLDKLPEVCQTFQTMVTFDDMYVGTKSVEFRGTATLIRKELTHFDDYVQVVMVFDH